MKHRFNHFLKMKKNICLSFLAYFILLNIVYSQDSFLDPAFGNNGKVEFSFSDKYESTSKLAMQSDGKVIAAGSYITRYNLDGTIDTTFGNNGFINTIHTTYYDDFWNLLTGNVGFCVTALDVQADNSIIVAFKTISQHDYGFHIRKYTSNGVLDPSFTYNSPITTYWTYDKIVNVLKCLPNNKLLIGGGRFFGEADSPTTLLLQLNADGSIDENFNTDVYYFSGVVRDIKIQNDGKFVIVGNYRFMIMPIYDYKFGIYCGRLNPDGTTDTSFGNLGFRTIVPPNTENRTVINISITSDNKIYLAGIIQDSDSQGNLNFPFICKLNTNGTEDLSFGTNGYIIKSDTQEVSYCKVFNNANNVFLAYSISATYVNQSSSFQIEKFDTNGQFQSIHLKNQSKKLNNFYDYAQLPNGDFYFLIRTFNFPVISLLKTNTNLDNITTFGNNGYANLSLEGGATSHSITPYHSLLQSDEKILVAGNGQYLSIVRFNTDGTTDVDFNTNLKYAEINPKTNKVALQSNQKILAGCYVQSSSYTGSIIITRINSNGTIDTTFAANGELQIPFYLTNPATDVFEILVDTDNSFFVVGNNYQTTSVPTTQIQIHKFTANGQIDNAYGIDGKVTNISLTYTSAVLTNHTIFVGGYLNNDFALTKILPSGSVDTTFGTNGLITTDFSIRNDKINKLLLTPTNKIIALGVSNGIIGLAKYNFNGTLDTSFGILGRILIDHTPTIDAIVNQDESIAFINKDNSNFKLKKISAVGQLEINFGENGSIYTDFDSGDDTPVSLLVQPDNKLVAIGGNTKLILSRYDANVLFNKTTTDFTDIINYYPNPFIDKISVEFINNSFENIINFKLLDYTGKTLYKSRQHIQDGENKIEIQLPTNLPKGYYILSMTVGNQQKNIKLIK